MKEQKTSQDVGVCQSIIGTAEEAGAREERKGKEHRSLLLYDRSHIEEMGRTSKVVSDEPCSDAVVETYGGLLCSE